MTEFYRAMLQKLIDDGIVNPSDSLLVVAGGPRDSEALAACGFERAVVSNLDSYDAASILEPYEWSYQDAERLEFEDQTFDFAIVHEGLHHCLSPHRALLEMYRVSRKGVMIIEPKDNWITRLGKKLNIGQEYEHSAVFHNDCRQGGVRNTNIPNFVYRWTDAEIRKTITCSAPYGEHRFMFVNRLVLPLTQLKGRRNRLIYWLVMAAYPGLKLLDAVVPGFGNNFAAVMLKPQFPRDMHPWLEFTDGEFGPNRAWLEQKYRDASGGRDDLL